MGTGIPTLYTVLWKFPAQWNKGNRDKQSLSFGALVHCGNLLNVLLFCGRRRHSGLLLITASHYQYDTVISLSEWFSQCLGVQWLKFPPV